MGNEREKAEKPDQGNGQVEWVVIFVLSNNNNLCDEISDLLYRKGIKESNQTARAVLRLIDNFQNRNEQI